MVRSAIEYNVSVWSPYKKYEIEALEKVQKRATKIPSICKGLNYFERLKLLELPCLKFRRLRGDMIETYTILTGKYDKLASPEMNLNNLGITRGHNLKLCINRTKYDLRKHFFINRIGIIWNSLPNNVVKADNVNIFKNRLDKFWVSQDCVYDYQAELN